MRLPFAKQRVYLVHAWLRERHWDALREEVHVSVRHRCRLQAQVAAAMQGYETRRLLL